MFTSYYDFFFVFRFLEWFLPWCWLARLEMKKNSHKSDVNNRCKLQWGGQRNDIFLFSKIIPRIILEVSVLVEAVSHVSDILKFCWVSLSESELFSNQRTPCCSVYSLLLVKENDSLQTALEYVMACFFNIIFKVFVCVIARRCWM